MPISNELEAARQRETGETDVEETGETGRGGGETERPGRDRETGETERRRDGETEKDRNRDKGGRQKERREGITAPRHQR